MNPLSQYKLLIEIAVIGALVFALTIGVHAFLEHERDIGRNEVRQEYAAKLAEAKDAARAKEAEDNKRVKDAQDALTKAQETIRSLSAANAAASISLRDTASSISSRLPSLSADAVRDLARTYGDIFTECQSRRGELAEKAERLNSEKRALIDAWPK